VSFSRNARSSNSQPAIFATTLIVASTVVFARVLVLISATARNAFPQLAPPMIAMLVVMTAISITAWFRSRQEKASQPDPENPAELKPAIIFGLLYAGVLLAVEAARDWFGQAGVYGVAILSGLTDMDAITLSMSEIVQRGELPASTGWRAILLASLSNIVFKVGIVAVLGTKALLWRISIAFGIAIAGGTAILVFWPA
jgi:uncharacterized membrane protein (DUF4010 family)